MQASCCQPLTAFTLSSGKHPCARSHAAAPSKTLQFRLQSLMPCLSTGSILRFYEEGQPHTPQFYAGGAVSSLPFSFHPAEVFEPVSLQWPPRTGPLHTGPEHAAWIVRCAACRTVLGSHCILTGSHTSAGWIENGSDETTPPA